MVKGAVCRFVNQEAVKLRLVRCKKALNVSLLRLPFLMNCVTSSVAVSSRCLLRRNRNLRLPRESNYVIRQAIMTGA